MRPRSTPVVSRPRTSICQRRKGKRDGDGTDDRKGDERAWLGGRGCVRAEQGNDLVVDEDESREEMGIVGSIEVGSLRMSRLALIWMSQSAESNFKLPAGVILMARDLDLDRQAPAVAAIRESVPS